jgi:MFS family permease
MLDRAFSTVPFLFYLIAIVAFLVPDFHKDRNVDPALVKMPLPLNLKWFLLCNSLYNFALYGASSFLSIYMKSLGGSALWVTMMFAGGVVCEVLILRQSGRFSDIYGRRPLLVFTFAILPLRLMLYIACVAPLGVFLVQILHGLNFGIMGAIAIVLVNDLATDANRGQAQARLAVSSGIASTFSPVILGLVSQYYGLRAMFAVAAVFALAGFLILVYKLQETHPAAQPLSSRGPDRLRWLMRLLEAPPSSS